MYVVRRGWHIDLGFPVEQLNARLTLVSESFPAARYLLFGFGDRHYVETADHGAVSMLAALWPGPGVMLVTGLTSAPSLAFGAEHVLELKLTPTEIRKLEDFVTASLIVKEPAQGPYQGSLYFSSPWRYSAVYTCNTWVAEALQNGAVPIGSKHVVFADSLWREVQTVRDHSKNK